MNIPEKCKECEYMRYFTFSGETEPTFSCIFHLFKKNEGKKCEKNDGPGSGTEAV